MQEANGFQAGWIPKKKKNPNQTPTQLHYSQITKSQKWKENLESNREKCDISHKGTTIWLTTNFSIKTM